MADESRKRGFYDDPSLMTSSNQSPPRKQASGMDDMQVPENCVGLVIGRGGSEIQSILNATGCRVVVSTRPNVPGHRTVELFGSDESIQSAKQHINGLVLNAALNAALRPAPAPTSKSNVISIDIPIPAHRCGAIIGKGGETMKRIRNISGCHAVLIQENRMPNATKPLRITGPPESIELAQKYVMDILTTTGEFAARGDTEDFAANQMVGNGPESNMSVTLKVPRGTVGAIMGVQGLNIRKIATETDTKIQFMPDDDPTLMERGLVVIGRKGRVEVAARVLRKIVEENSADVNQPTTLFYLTVPQSKCGLVIGRGGEVIRQISAVSGAHCELSREPETNPNEKTFVIRGADQSVEHAKFLIGQRLGDIPVTEQFVRKIEAFVAPQAPPPLQYHLPQLQYPLLPSLQYPLQYPAPLQYPGNYSIPIFAAAPEMAKRSRFDVIPGSLPTPPITPDLQLQYPHLQYPPPQATSSSYRTPEPSAYERSLQELMDMVKTKKRESQEARDAEKTREEEAEKPDYTQAWLQYFQNTGDESGMAQVRKRIQDRGDQ